MTRHATACARETEVLDLIAIGQWPARADADLAAHVASCPNCVELALVASAIVDVRDSGEGYRHLPDSGIVWLRAQMRAREDATNRAARPLWLAQFAGVAAVVAILAIWSSGLMGSVSGVASSGWTSMTDLFARVPELFVLSIQPAGGGTGAETATRWLIPGLIVATLGVIALAFGVSKLADGDGEEPR
ncbi:MAG: hypothetical protein ABI634_12320 [Acidobacteriota bacterium]